MKASCTLPFIVALAALAFGLFLLKGKDKVHDVFTYQAGAHLKALDILVWILAPESMRSPALFIRK